MIQSSKMMMMMMISTSSEQDPNLPRLYAHGDPDPRPLKSWPIKELMPAAGHGLHLGSMGHRQDLCVSSIWRRR